MTQRPFVYPRRKPKSKKWLYCRLCNVELLATERMEHDAAEPHASLLAQLKRWEFIDEITGGYRCPGRVLNFQPWAALIDNILYDAAALQRRAVVHEAGVSLPRRPVTGR